MSGKVCLITGATAGIGWACAVVLAKEGYDVVAIGRRKERLDQLKSIVEKCGRKFTGLCFDLRSEEECQKHIQPIPKIDLLVNNAGLAIGMDHIDVGNPKDWDIVIDTNVKGFLYVASIVSKKMVSAGKGHIINIGSIAGTQPYENGAVYCATKHAVHAISSSMQKDLLSKGVKVSEVRPGTVETEFSHVRFRGDNERAKKVYEGFTPLKAEDVAEAVRWVASLPPHMNVQDMLVMPSVQCDLQFYKKI